MLQDSVRCQLDFLLTDIAAAHTFLDVAETTRDADSRTRNVQHARDAYDSVLRFGNRAHLSPQQADDFRPFPAGVGAGRNGFFEQLEPSGEQFV